ncbi:putative hetero-Diels-Alderase [Pseudocercospora fuligena]|uniref:Putative hetero-Diels-Alderase n=1 Tax=Pseudocercospora fuligena TaxID=685502 RepID=A0A8H6RUA0_9PEZI|nr:putative hetero-Diels-Alderase [Pseudocercospora fuligena]
MLANLAILAVAVTWTHATPLPTSGDHHQLTVQNITRFANFGFENLAIRPNGQVLSTTTNPNARIYQIDPLNILPPTIVHTIPNVSSANGIVEGKPDVYYVASGHINLTSPSDTVPSSYSITELDMRGVFVLPNGRLSRKPATKRIANLPNAALLNGIALARPESEHLLVADTFRGLIWNVNVQTGNVGIALNDTTTKGSSSNPAGVNGMKVHNGSLYWTNTGQSKLYKVAIDKQGNVQDGDEAEVVTSNIVCDDLVLDHIGNAYVASPLGLITKVSPGGHQEVIAGNSTGSKLNGPTAVRFGRLASDRWSLYVTTDGGIPQFGGPINGTQGVSRIDLRVESASN